MTAAVDSIELAAALDLDGFAVVEGWFTSADVDELTAVLARRRWPMVPDALLGWLGADRWRALVVPLVAPEVAVVREQLVTKAPRSAAEVPWHQDDAYARIAGEFLTCFVALDDLTLDNGCLWMLPGSHRDGPREHRPHGYLHEVAEAPHGPGVAVPLTRGSMVVFGSLTLHRSGPNATDGTRPAWMVQFAPAPVRERPVTTGPGS